MKTLAMIIMALFLAGGLSAQEKAINKEVVKTAKQKRKEKRDSVFKQEYLQLCDAIDSMSFVLEADYLSNQRGEQLIVPSNLNFIMVDSLEAILQTGSNGRVGSNGVGGVTLEGKITNWKVVKNSKHGSFFITMDIMTNLGFYSVYMDISANGRASATLSGIRPGRLTWDGWLKPLNNTSAYQGTSTMVEFRNFPPAFRSPVFHKFSHL